MSDIGFLVVFILIEIRLKRRNYFKEIRKIVLRVILKYIIIF